MRLGLYILGGAIILVLVLAAWRLIPPHIQIRGVTPPHPEDAELRTLLTATDGPIGIRYVNTSTQQLPDGKLGHTVFLVEYADGRLFMIDAGMDGPTAVEFGRLLESALGAEVAVSHGTIAELLGDGVDRVSGIGFTHLHIDHTQGVSSFCDARGPGATAFQTHWQKRLHNFNTAEGAEIVAESCLEFRELGGAGLVPVDGFPGVAMFGLGGHTPGSTLFAVAAQGRLWLFSGDTTNTKANLIQNVGKGFLYSYLLVPENTARTESLRVWLAVLVSKPDITVVVSHDLADVEASGLAEYSR